MNYQKTAIVVRLDSIVGAYRVKNAAQHEEIRQAARARNATISLADFREHEGQFVLCGDLRPDEPPLVDTQISIDEVITNLFQQLLAAGASGLTKAVIIERLAGRTSMPGFTMKMQRYLETHYPQHHLAKDGKRYALVTDGPETDNG